MPERKSRFSKSNGSLLTLPSVRDLGGAKYLIITKITSKVLHDSHKNANFVVQINGYTIL